MAVPFSLLCFYPAVGGSGLADVADVLEPSCFVACCLRCVEIDDEERPDQVDLVELGTMHLAW